LEGEVGYVEKVIRERKDEEITGVKGASEKCALAGRSLLR
jgi:hypothetical protein